MSNYFQVTSLDPDELKASLIEFLQNDGGFNDFDYEGSAINTIVDTLVFNGHRTSYEGNMIANESFLDSAQIRGNVSSHAQKLSYVPRSKTAARIVCDLTVRAGASVTSTSITCDKGSVFLRSVGGVTYTFTNPESFLLFNGSGNDYFATDVELVQGQLLSNQFIYDPSNSDKIIIPNRNIDTNTLRVFVKDTATSTAKTEFLKVVDITEISSDSAVFHLGVNRKDEYYIQFGDDVLGQEPIAGSVIEIEYVSVEDEIGNGVSTLIAGSTIANQSDIEIVVTTPAYGGKDLPSLEEIKFIAPKSYQSQNRAVRPQDYEIETLKRFPYIKAARAWGGEKNDPPSFGNVFVAVIPDDGIYLTDYLRREMVNTLDGINVGSITPVIVDPEYFDIILTPKIKVDYTKTAKKFVEVGADVSSYIDSYADSLLNFGTYYNNSYLIDFSRDSNSAIESIEFDKVVRKSLDASPNVSTTYTANFRNKVRKETLAITGVVTNISATQESIYDEDGVIYIKKEFSNSETITSIGAIDYETGEISFSLVVLNNNDLVVEVEPEDDNFYAKLQAALRLSGTTPIEIVEV